LTFDLVPCDALLTVGRWRDMLDWGRLVIDLGGQLTSIQKTLRNLETEVEALTRDVADLKRKHGLVPLDVGVEDGIPWGLVGSERHPFCPVCQAKGEWMPLPRDSESARRSFGGKLYCRACKSTFHPPATLAAWLVKGA
jgi:hypothetical protein